jgi:hypothetical protein
MSFDEPGNRTKIKLPQMYEALAEIELYRVPSPGVRQEHIDWPVRLHLVIIQPEGIKLTDQYRPRAARLRSDKPRRLLPILFLVEPIVVSEAE